ncbi:PP-loop domain protein [Denitrovibrio acetiphilus DSM 12809]|uniref:PP-loop domain protein n=1 Tax=Denitrovibrio acetiphilus (strain DSM 12809 / NBRC 114555 / N2460) TaxID=522772 RepID=D4H8T2_DENA2|nr:ATP-binding protein [Denitrovibrio acetiphilus]ADD68431.1 PP-loop domain protein [Denitrovibrio acetiphilus DSM 12809]
MKCRKCSEKALITLRRHNASFCKEHFNEFFIKQVEKGIKEYKMFDFSDKIMVCISGGKDSLVLWYLLHKMGYETTGMYINLGIGEYSEKSLRKVEAFTEKFGLKAVIVNLTELGHPIPLLEKSVKRHACSICGIAKRYYFNKVAYENNFDVVATGHNLDDESARLLGNVLKWDPAYLSKMDPNLPEEGDYIKRKVKPLIRLTELEVGAFAFMNGIDYITDECPKSVGATSMLYKGVLNSLESDMPGTKHYFYNEFFRTVADRFRADSEEKTEMYNCAVCGMESFLETCSFCKMLEKMK